MMWTKFSQSHEMAPKEYNDNGPGHALKLPTTSVFYIIQALKTFSC